MDNEAWERLRHVTLDQLVTAVKLAGCGVTVHGHTTPEGWPFTLVLGIGSPGNARAVDIVDSAVAELQRVAPTMAAARAQETQRE